MKSSSTDTPDGGWRARAFRFDRFDRIVKLGGSVVWSGKRAGVAEALAATTQRLLIFPGGGEPDNHIEQIDHEQGLSRPTINRATLLAQDQTGLLLADSEQRLTPVATISDAESAVERAEVPVLLPSLLIGTLNPFRYTGKVTSDTMALWLATLLDVPQLTLVKSRLPSVQPPTLDTIRDDRGYVDVTFPHLAAASAISIAFYSSEEPGLLARHLCGECHNQNELQ